MTTRLTPEPCDVCGLSVEALREELQALAARLDSESNFHARRELKAEVRHGAVLTALQQLTREVQTLARRLAPSLDADPTPPLASPHGVAP